MSFTEAWRPPAASEFDAERALCLQVGVLSPLWAPMAAAAATGVAVWGFSRWMRLAIPEGALEMVAASAAEPAVAASQTVAVVADPVTEAPVLLGPDLPAPQEAAPEPAAAAAPAAPQPEAKPAAQPGSEPKPAAKAEPAPDLEAKPPLRTVDKAEAPRGPRAARPSPPRKPPTAH